MASDLRDVIVRSLERDHEHLDIAIARIEHFLAGDDADRLVARNAAGETVIELR